MRDVESYDTQDQINKWQAEEPHEAALSQKPTSWTDSSTLTAPAETSHKTQAAVHQGLVQTETLDPKAIFATLQKKAEASTLPFEAADFDAISKSLDSVVNENALKELNILSTKYKDASDLLAQKQKELPRTSDPQKQKELGKEIQSLKTDIKYLEKEILEKGLQFSQSISTACQGAHSGALQSLGVLSEASSMAAAASEELPEAASGALSSITSLVNFVTQVNTHHDITQKLGEMKDKLTEMRKNLPATQKDAAVIESLQNGIISLQQQRRTIEENGISLFARASSTAITGTSEILKAITYLRPNDAASLLNRLNSVHTAGGVATGAIALVLSAKQIIDLRENDAKVLAKIAELHTQKEAATTNPSLVRLIDMKIKNLEMIHESNQVQFVQAITNISSSVLGTSAGAISLFAIAGAATGAVAVVGATAGVGALVLAGGAVAVGVGYYAYKHREEIAVYAELSSAYAEQGFLKAQDIFSHKWEQVDQKRAKAMSSTRQRKEDLNKQWNTRIEQITNKINDEGSARIARLQELEMQTPSEKNPMREEEIASLATEIVLWRDIKNSLMEKVAALHTSDVHFEMKALDEIDSKIEGLKNALQQNENKRLHLQERLENCKVSSALKNTTTDEVAEFRATMKELLKDPEISEEVRLFMVGNGALLNAPPTETDLMAFISRPEL